MKNYWLEKNKIKSEILTWVTGRVFLGMWMKGKWKEKRMCCDWGDCLVWADALTKFDPQPQTSDWAVEYMTIFGYR